jgi:hypothetical protein
MPSGEVQPEDETTLRPLVPGPEDFIVVAAGGQAGSFSCYIPGWSSKRSSQSVTRDPAALKPPPFFRRMKEIEMTKFEVFDPTVKAKKEKIVYAQRPKSLQDVRIGLVDNTKYHSDKLLLKIATFWNRSMVLRVMSFGKAKASVPAHEEIIMNIRTNVISSLLVLATEVRAARAVCSTGSCLKKKEFPRFRLSPIPWKPAMPWRTWVSQFKF